MVSGDSIPSLFFNMIAPEKYCPHCHCEIRRYWETVSSTVSAGSRSSKQERETYYKLYGELIYDVPHYNKNSINLESKS